jgi:hypothetical protein
MFTHGLFDPQKAMVLVWQNDVAFHVGHKPDAAACETGPSLDVFKSMISQCIDSTTIALAMGRRFHP